jgi:hypothetical protein
VDSTIDVHYLATESLPPKDWADLYSGGPDKLIKNSHQRLCEQTGQCAKLVATSTGTIGGTKVSLFHYQLDAGQFDHPGVVLNEYVMGTIGGTTYYQLSLIISSETSNKITAERVTKFMQMARTFNVE